MRKYSSSHQPVSRWDIPYRGNVSTLTEVDSRLLTGVLEKDILVVLGHVWNCRTPGVDHKRWDNRAYKFARMEETDKGIGFFLTYIDIDSPAYYIWIDGLFQSGPW